MRQLKIIESITNRSNRSLNLYLNEVGKIELLSADEEVALAVKIRAGDQAALDRLTSANLRFVVSVAKQYQHQGLVLEDLINEGNEGLLKAAKRFDETKGFKFISYAVWWIRQSIMVAIAVQSRVIRIPGNQISSLIKLRRVRIELEQHLEREPSTEELAKGLDIPVGQVLALLSHEEKHLSMDAPSSFLDEMTLLDRLSSTDPATDQRLIDDSLLIWIDGQLDKLEERERKILILFYGLHNRESKTLEEIAHQLKLTPERIRQLKMKALLQIKRLAQGQNSLDLLE